MKANQPLVDLVGRIVAHKNAAPAECSSGCSRKSPGSYRSLARGRCIAWKRTSARPQSKLTCEDLREIDTEASKIKVRGARGTGQEQYA